jgi:hypothetical protein
MPKSHTLAALRAKWPHTTWRIVRGDILPRLRWVDGPSPDAVNTLLCSDINTPVRFGRTLSDGALRILGEQVLHKAGIDVPFMPADEYADAQRKDAPCWTAADNYLLCNGALARLAHYKNVWGLDFEATQLSFRHSFEEDVP